MADLPRVLSIMGSGETAPTMVTTHQELLAMLPADSRAVLVETPYGFQENATEISDRTIDYFRARVGHDMAAVGPRTPDDGQSGGWDTTIATLQDADYVFAGPGSPTYALDQWRASAFPDVLRTKLRNGGIVNFASAAAVGLGHMAVPVYEIYKVGRAPQWVPGLDLLSIAGITAAVIPHFDNAEGGTHDTRFCYLGARRLDLMERQLDADALVIGVDEHTALILDLNARTASVRGRGGVTVRRSRRTLRVIGSGSQISLAGLQQAAAITADGAMANPVTATPPPPQAAEREATALTLTEQVQRATAAFDAALEARAAKDAVAAILDLEAAIAQWSADTTQSDEGDRARAALRGLIVRLGDAAAEGLRDPIEQISPLADVVVRTRTALRRRKDYELADALRDDAADAGLELRDTAEGTTWHLLTDS
jgi:cyanophycinase-like exopeptidase